MTTDHSTRPLAKRVGKQIIARQFGRVLRSYDVVGSTNTVAKAWAENGAAEGSVVMAEYQWAGRGRRGRSWQSNPGENLLFSVVLRPRLRPEQLGLVTLAAGVALAEGLQAYVDQKAITLKWPNDVLIRGRKCCGMLLESVIARGQDPVVVLGIGLNVNQESFAAPLAPRATSLLLESGRLIPRADLLALLLLKLEMRYENLHRNPKAVCTDYLHYLHGRGQTVHLDGPPPVSGRIVGINEFGALRLDAQDGHHFVYVGDVHPVGECG